MAIINVFIYSLLYILCIYIYIYTCTSSLSIYICISYLLLNAMDSIESRTPLKKDVFESPPSPGDRVLEKKSWKGQMSESK